MTFLMINPQRSVPCNIRLKSFHMQNHFQNDKLESSVSGLAWKIEDMVALTGTPRIYSAICMSCETYDHLTMVADSQEVIFITCFWTVNNIWTAYDIWNGLILSFQCKTSFIPFFSFFLLMYFPIYTLLSFFYLSELQDTRICATRVVKLSASINCTLYCTPAGESTADLSPLNITFFKLKHNPKKTRCHKCVTAQFPPLLYPVLVF